MLPEVGDELEAEDDCCIARAWYLLYSLLLLR